MTTLHLTVSTPATILVDIGDVAAIRAEDEGGSFGILPGHADLLVVLPISILRWKQQGGAVHYCAIHHGVLRVESGRKVVVACREGVLGDDIDILARDIEQTLSTEREAERNARVKQMRLETRAIRRIVQYLQP